MRRKIIPARGTMTAQRPGTKLGLANTLSGESWSGKRSFVFYPSKNGNFDYLTQMPTTSSSTSNYPSPSAELMFGGGLLDGGLVNAKLSNIGNVDDTKWDTSTEAYLSGALASGSNGGYFGRNWGQEGRPEDSGISSSLYKDEELGEGRVIKSWGGILSFSADRMPWVGRLPAKIAGRKGRKLIRSTERRAAAPWARIRAVSEEEGEKARDDITLADDNSSQYEGLSSNQDPNPYLAAPGEWIAAGYTGEGMTHAWLSAKALAYMVLDKEDSDEFFLPNSFRVTEKRWRKARLEDLV